MDKFLSRANSRLSQMADMVGSRPQTAAQSGRPGTAGAQSVTSQQQAASNAKAKYTQDELDEYAQVFALFDTDGSGAIGTDELGEAMTSMGLNATQAELEQLIREIDADGNGEIDFEEFCDCMKKMTTKKHTDEEIIRECFQVFDQDGNGVVSHAEWKHVLREVGGFTDTFADELFQEIDIAGNGHLDYEEFAMMVRSYLLDDEDKRSTV